MDLFAGLDVSTQSCKLVVIDLDRAEVVHVDAVTYDDDLPQFGTRQGIIPGQAPGVAESDPRMWIAAVELVFSRMQASGTPGEAIRAVSVSGQQHGLVALTEEGTLAHPRAKLWHDTSTHAECEELTEAVGGLDAMIREVGNSQRPGYTAGKILHLVRHHPDAYARASTLFLVHNYVNWYLTGGVRIMEPGDTSGMALRHPAASDWSDPVLRAIDGDLRRRLPIVAPADASIGTVAPDVAARLGLSPSCVVDAGSGDNMYGAIGTGNVRPGMVTVSLGTSGTAYTFMESPFVDPVGEVASFCDSTGHYLPLVCVSNLANGYNDVLDTFGLTHDAFAEIVAQQPVANGGRMIVPWYESERTPDIPIGAATAFGFRPGEWTPETVCPAILAGHVLNLQAGFSRLGVRPDEIRLTGGLAKSAAWRQAIADHFDAPTLPVQGEGAALGAALHAAWVYSKEHGDPEPIEAVIEPFVQLDARARCEPVADRRGTIAKQRRLFAALSDRLRGIGGEDPFCLRAELL